MVQVFLSRFGWFISLLLLQVLVFNNIHIFGFATPMPYIYFLLILPGETARWLYIVLGFVMGMLVDLFATTPGVAASSMAAMGLIVPLLLRLFGPTDRDENVPFLPGVKMMEWGPFLRYAFAASLLNCTLFFSIEAFSFFNWQYLLMSIGGSTILTLLIVAAMERIRNEK